MSKIILVPVDFSPASENATDYAAEMALVINADILLLHIYQIPVVYLEIPFAVKEEEIRQDAENKINVLKKRLIKEKQHLTIETEVRTGVFFHELKTVCENIDPYYVIMGNQGTTAVERLLFGGHTVEVMKRLMYPLITVPLSVTFSSIKRIGLACDLHNVVDTIPVDEIKMLVENFNAELHVLNIDRFAVFNPHTDYDSVLLEEELASLHPTYHFLTNENTDKAIIDFTEINNIDLLIMVPRRSGLLRKLIHKSHTKQLVIHSHVPVMAMHYQLDKSHSNESIHQKV